MTDRLGENFSAIPIHIAGNAPAERHLQLKPLRDAGGIRDQIDRVAPPGFSRKREAMVPSPGLQNHAGNRADGRRSARTAIKDGEARFAGRQNAMDQPHDIRDMVPIPHFPTRAAKHNVGFACREPSAEIPEQLLAQPFAIDRKEASHRDWLAVCGTIRPAKLLDHAFVIAIGRIGIERRVDPDRTRMAAAIDGRRGCKNDRCIGCASAQEIEDTSRRDNALFKVRQGIGNRLADRRATRQMINGRWATMCCQSRIHCFHGYSSGKKYAAGRQRKTRCFFSTEADDMAALLTKKTSEVQADETAGPGHPDKLSLF
nr:hypothetical protein [Mesorhizobium sp.]